VWVIEAEERWKAPVCPPVRTRRPGGASFFIGHVTCAYENARVRALRHTTTPWSA